MKSIKIDILTSQFDQNSEAPVANIENSKYIYINDCEFTNNSNQESLGSALYLKDSKTINISKTLFKSNKGLNGAGIFTSQVSNLKINSCEFLQNDVLTYGLGFGAGVYSLENTNLQILDSKFIENQSGAGGGGVYIHKSSNSLIEKTLFLRNQASKGGSIVLSQNQKTVLREAVIRQNKAHMFAGAFQVYSNFGDVLVYDTIFESNEVIAYGACTLFHYNKQLILFQNTTITNHTAQNLGGALYDFNNFNTQFVNMTMKNNSCLGQAGDIKVKLTKTVTIANSTFTDYTAFLGGSIHFETIEKQLLIQNCIFNSINKMQSKYTIILESMKQIQITGIHIQENQQSINKVGGLLSRKVNSISISNSKFEDHYTDFYGGGLYFDRVNDIFVEDSQVLNSIAQIDGGGIYVFKTDNLIIKNTIIKNNEAQRGGGIFITKSDIIQFDNGLQIQNNKASDQKDNSVGGGLYLFQIKKMCIYNSAFLDNSAQMYGGGIFIQNILKIDIQNSNFIRNQVNFDENLNLENKLQDYKLTQGGGIYFDSFRQSLTELYLLNNTFINNKASSGGGILLLEEVDTIININIAKNNIFKENLADYGPSVRYLGDRADIMEIQFKYGQNMQESANNQGKIGQQQLVFKYYYNERKINKQTNKIELCPPGTFLLEGGTVLCESCPYKGLCKGGYQKITNKNNYWMEYQNSQEFYDCLTENICLEDNKCAEGHMGVKCKQCDTVNYYYEPFQYAGCQKCMDSSLAILIRQN